MTRSTTVLAALALAVGTSACQTGETMTNAEVLQALEETRDSSRGEDATTEPIEISTEFTIGDAVEAAAQQIRDFWQSQQPCTDILWEGNKLTIDYGTLDDACTFQGKTYAGIAEVTVDSTELGQLQVTHDWIGINNGDVQVDGGAFVTWDGSDETRHVTTEHTWTDLDDGEMVDVVGDHVWGRIDEGVPGWIGGYTLEGTRDWTSDSGEWSIDMNDLELRLIDPVAQAGTIVLTNPDGKELTLVHERQDETTIRVTLTSGLREWVYDINALGIPTEVEGEGSTGA